VLYGVEFLGGMMILKPEKCMHLHIVGFKLLAGWLIKTKNRCIDEKYLVCKVL